MPWTTRFKFLLRIEWGNLVLDYTIYNAIDYRHLQSPETWKDFDITINLDGSDKAYSWNVVRSAINSFLSTKLGINEDKLLGPFFINGTGKNENEIRDAFEDKVLMYLFEDAARLKRDVLFSGCENNTRFSAILNGFEEKGFDIFNSDITKIINNETD